MSQPRFLADENLRFVIVQAVRRLEPAIEFATVLELGRSGIADPDLLEFALADGWVVVSHDVNTLGGFAEERLRAGTGTAGFLLVPQTAPVYPVARDLHLIWAITDASEWTDRIDYLPL